MLQEKKHPILHLICGLPGSGKTTLAKSISESSGACRFSPDEWIKEIWKGNAEAEGNQFRDQIEQIQWRVAKQMLNNSIDVIIEWGTWGRIEREKLRDEARAVGASVKFYYLNISRDILKERVLERNKRIDKNEFYIPEEEVDAFLDDCFKSFQIPSAEELATYDFIG
jgi:predicted kinase